MGWHRQWRSYRHNSSNHRRVSRNWKPSTNPKSRPMPSIIDVAQNVTPNIVHIKADGILTTVRYLTTNTASGKLIMPAEAHVLSANGIRLGLVFEAGGGAPGQAPLTAVQGQIDGTFA